MHCPGCGHESSLDQKFCRKCGFNLEPVSKLITGQAGSEEIQTEKSEQERRLVRRMFRWISWGCLVLLFGVILLIFNRGFIHEALFQPLSSLLILGGVAMATYGVLSTVLKGTYLPGKTSTRTAAEPIEQAKATDELTEPRVPTFMPSVTDRTTQLIDEPAAIERQQPGQ